MEEQNKKALRSDLNSAHFSNHPDWEKWPLRLTCWVDQFKSGSNNCSQSNMQYRHISYRVELWRAITRFEGSFPLWWLQRPIRLHGVPAEWPQQVPSEATMNFIFLDFEHNYRSFEAWHAAQRRELSQRSPQENMDKIFATIKMERHH